MLRFSQLLDHAPLLKDRVSLHQVLPSVVPVYDFLIGRILHDNHERTNDLLSLGQLGTDIAVEQSFQDLHFFQLLQCILKLIAPQVYESHVSLDLARTHILQSVSIFVNYHSLVQVDERLLDEPRLLLPSTQLSGDPGDKVSTLVLLELLIH